MNDVGKKRRRKEAFLHENPFCCFCGGLNRATTVDHVPSRQMFSLRRRPKGLEVPACKSCNQAIKRHEQVAAMLGRIFPDGATVEEREEMKKIMSAVARYSPGVLEEMKPSRSQQERGGIKLERLPGAAGVLNCSGPLLNESIQKFGGKLGLALHYETTNRIVPIDGGVAVRWYSNYDAVTDGLPKELFRYLGPERTLQQGSWNVHDQFGYAYAVSENSFSAGYFATFRISFAVLCWVNENVANFGDVDPIHKPGMFTLTKHESAPYVRATGQREEC